MDYEKRDSHREKTLNSNEMKEEMTRDWDLVNLFSPMKQSEVKISLQFRDARPTEKIQIDRNGCGLLFL
jgi:hypothetical protein